MSRSWQLYHYYLASALHRLRHDFTREIVVGICALVIFALFFYVFNDFLNTEVRSVSAAMREVFATWAAIALWAVASMFAGRMLRREKDDERSWGSLADHLGESPEHLRYYRRMVSLTILLICYLPAFYIAETYLVQLKLLQWVIVLCLMGGLTVVSYSLHQGKGHRKPRTSLAETGEVKGIGEIHSASLQGDLSDDLLKKLDRGRVNAMTLWRLRLMTRRNRLTRLLLGLSVAFLFLTGYVALTTAPTFVGILSAFMAGSFLMAALAYQLGDDLEYAWVERNLGVSHEVYCRSLGQLALRLGVPLALATALVWFALRGLGVFDQEEVLALSLDSLKMGLMVWTPVWIYPSLAFQVDARRPALQIMVGFLICLFVCTAIFASLFAIILAPLVTYYAGSGQQGYFYRA